MTAAQRKTDETRTEARLRLLMDRTEINDLIYNYAFGVDTRDWTLFRSCFTDEIEADLGGDLDRFCGAADDWVRLARDLVEQFDATRHLMTNIQASIDGDRAVCRCYVQAQHVRVAEIGDRRYIVGGIYRHEVVRTAGGWRSQRYSFTPLWTRGNRRFFVDAVRQALQQGRP